MRFFNSVLSLLPLRFVSSLLEEPEVAVIGAGRGPAGSIIHKLFVSAQRVNTPLAYAHTHTHIASIDRFPSPGLALCRMSHCGLQVEERA